MCAYTFVHTCNHVVVVDLCVCARVFVCVRACAGVGVMTADYAGLISP